MCRQSILIDNVNRGEMMFIRNEKLNDYMRMYPVVTTLIILNIVLHLFKLIPGIGPLMYLIGIGSNEMVAYGEWWRLITPMFLHADFMHLLMNMFSLYIFGPDLEKLIGKMRFITLFLLSGIFANIATYFLEPLSYIHVGASGAIFGIFGAFLALVYYTRDNIPQLKQIILPIVGISVVLTFLGSNINQTAHIGGLIVGFLIGLSYFHPKRIMSWKK